MPAPSTPTLAHTVPWKSYRVSLAHSCLLPSSDCWNFLHAACGVPLIKPRKFSKIPVVNLERLCLRYDADLGMSGFFSPSCDPYTLDVNYHEQNGVNFARSDDNLVAVSAYFQKRIRKIKKPSQKIIYFPLVEKKNFLEFLNFAAPIC